MTFSGTVKAELCNAPIDKYKIEIAELCGMFLFANTFSANEIKITTENPDFAHRASRILKMLFGFDFDKKIVPREATKKHSLGITNKDKLKQVLESFGFDLTRSHTVHLNGALVEDDLSRAAFLRGAFLSGGSIMDPANEYHLELVTSHYYLVREVKALLYELEINARITQRKGNHIVYFKDSEEIEELLTRMGAPISAMGVMDAKALKELRNSINRRSNCEVANISKTIDAAAKQIEAIEIIKDTKGLETLTPQLYEVAVARLANPDATMTELCEILGGTVTKSGLNHRLRKLIEISKGMR
ncbi:MAG: DNA-binding protein WhiA [Clostridia bacterium]|nr:DNA-binding protein WhiA [Clostridia bacterium]